MNLPHDLKNYSPSETDPFQILTQEGAGWILLNLLLWGAVFADYL